MPIDEAKCRADFEAVITAPPYECDIRRFDDSAAWPGNYRDYRVDLAWHIWRECAMQAETRLDSLRARVGHLRQMIALQAALTHPDKTAAEIQAEIDRVLEAAMQGRFPR